MRREQTAIPPEPEMLRQLRALGYEEASDLLSLCNRLPASANLDDRRVLRIRIAVSRKEGTPGRTQIAEVVSTDTGRAEVVWPKRLARGRNVSRSVDMPPEYWAALESTGETASATLRAIVAEWMRRREEDS